MSEELKLKKLELAAVILAVMLVWGALLMAPSSDCAYKVLGGVTQHPVCRNQWRRIVVGTHFTDWILAVVGLGQLIVLVIQAGISGEQAAISDRQARLMEQQINIARGDPFLFIVTKTSLADVFRFSGGTIIYDKMETASFAEVPVLQFWIKNYGDAPAVLISVGARLAISAIEPSAQTAYPFITMPAERVLLPNLDTGPFSAGLRPGQANNIPRPVFNDLKSGRQYIWLFGEIRYDSKGHDRYTMQFCWRYDTGLDEFRPHPPERNYVNKLSNHTPTFAA